VTVADGKPMEAVSSGPRCTFNLADLEYVGNLLNPGEVVRFQTVWSVLKKYCCDLFVSDHLAHLTVVTNQRVIFATFNQVESCTLCPGLCKILPEDVTSFRLNDISSVRTSNKPPRLGWLIMSAIGLLLCCIGIFVLDETNGGSDFYIGFGVVLILLGMLLTYVAEDDPTFLVLEMHCADLTQAGFIVPFLKSLKLQKNKQPIYAEDSETLVRTIMNMGPPGSPGEQVFTSQFDKPSPMTHEVILTPSLVCIKSFGPSSLPCCNVKRSCQEPVCDFKVIRRRDVQAVRMVIEGFNRDLWWYFIFGFLQILFGFYVSYDGSQDPIIRGIFFFVLLWGVSNIAVGCYELTLPVPPALVVYDIHGANVMQGTLTTDEVLLGKASSNKCAAIPCFGCCCCCCAGPLEDNTADGVRSFANMVPMDTETARALVRASVAHPSFV